MQNYVYMTELKKYLETQLDQLTKNLEVWLEFQKRAMQDFLNDEMQRQIAIAKDQCERSKQRFVDLFNSQMAELDERRRKEPAPFMQRMYDRIEESNKAQLERNLKLAETQFTSFVEFWMKNAK